MGAHYPCLNAYPCLLVFRAISFHLSAKIFCFAGLPAMILLKQPIFFLWQGLYLSLDFRLQRVQDLDKRDALDVSLKRKHQKYCYPASDGKTRSYWNYSAFATFWLQEFTIHNTTLTSYIISVWVRNALELANVCHAPVTDFISRAFKWKLFR